MREKTDSKRESSRPSSAADLKVGGIPPVGAGAEIERKAGLSCVKRLPSYLQLLRVLQAEGQENVSGTVLASVHHLEPVIVRKDLAITGIAGTPRVGFRVTELINAIERFLGWDNQTKAVLVGTGNLGAALLGYRGFENYGLLIVAAFDVDPQKVGKWVHGYKVQSMNHLASFVRRGEIKLGVLTVPAEAARTAADLMISGWHSRHLEFHTGQIAGSRHGCVTKGRSGRRTGGSFSSPPSFAGQPRLAIWQMKICYLTTRSTPAHFLDTAPLSLDRCIFR